MGEAVAGDAAGAPALVGVSRLYLVRHAHAGDRAAWQGPDAERPLSEKGWRQARGLAAGLARDDIAAITSSPAVRCVQTVEPLAAARGLTITPETRLLEGHDPADTLTWLTSAVGARPLLACTHGDLVPALLDLLAEAGATVPGERRWAKGSTWIVDAERGRWRRARYLPPQQG